MKLKLGDRILHSEFKYPLIVTDQITSMKEGTIGYFCLIEGHPGSGKIQIHHDDKFEILSEVPPSPFEETLKRAEQQIKERWPLLGLDFSVEGSDKTVVQKFNERWKTFEPPSIRDQMLLLLHSDNPPKVYDESDFRKLLERREILGDDGAIELIATLIERMGWKL